MSEASGTKIELYTVREVAAALRISPRAVRLAISAGKLGAIDVGAGRHRPLLRVEAKELERFLAARKVERS